MITFAQFVVEYPLSYYKALPDAVPPPEVMDLAKRFGLESHIKWKLLKNKEFKHSYEIETDTPDGIIAMRLDDEKENWFHEFFHELFDHSDKDSIKPLLDRIKVACRPSKEWLHKQSGRHYKWIELGEYKYTYSHSGPSYEYDEIFAICGAYIFGDHGKFKDAEVQKDYEAMLDKLACDKISV